MLERLRAEHPIALHGVSSSIAGSDPLDDAEYLRGLRELADRVEPAFVSDHLCWTTLGGHQSHDLLPVALNARVLEHVRRARRARAGALGRRILLENASAYVAFRADEMERGGVLRRAVPAHRLRHAARRQQPVRERAESRRRRAARSRALARGSVGYMHLAGHAVLADVRIDTHGEDVPSAVWALFEGAAHVSRADVIVERDDNLPEFAELRRRGRGCASGRAPRERGSRLRRVAPQSTRGSRKRRVARPQQEFWSRIAPGDRPRRRRRGARRDGRSRRRAGCASTATRTRRTCRARSR